MKFDKEKYLLKKIKQIDKRIKELKINDFTLHLAIDDVKTVFKIRNDWGNLEEE